MAATLLSWLIPTYRIFFSLLLSWIFCSLNIKINCENDSSQYQSLTKGEMISASLLIRDTSRIATATTRNEPNRVCKELVLVLLKDLNACMMLVALEARIHTSHTRVLVVQQNTADRLEEWSFKEVKPIMSNYETSTVADQIWPIKLLRNGEGNCTRQAKLAWVKHMISSQKGSGKRLKLKLWKTSYTDDKPSKKSSECQFCKRCIPHRSLINGITLDCVHQLAHDHLGKIL